MYHKDQCGGHQLEIAMTYALYELLGLFIAPNWYQLLSGSLGTHHSTRIILPRSLLPSIRHYAILTVDDILPDRLLTMTHACTAGAIFKLKDLRKMEYNRSLPRKKCV